MKSKLWIVIAIFVIAFFVQCAVYAQTFQAMRITWDPNPESENVGWYILQYGDGETWHTIAQTSTPDFTITFSSLNTDYSITPNDEVCYRVVAARDNDRSDPSEEVCTSFNGNPPTVPESQQQPLSQVQGVSVERIQ